MLCYGHVVHFDIVLSPSMQATEAQLFLERHPKYEEIDNISHRLQWCRHHKGLTQNDVATTIGISRNTYIKLETDQTQHFQKNIVDKLSTLFDIPFSDLLDDYSAFLYHGQGRAIDALREIHGLSPTQLAQLWGVDMRLLTAWELDERKMLKKTWMKYFKG